MVTYHLKHMGSPVRPRSLSRLDVAVPEELTVRELLAYLLERGDLIGRREDYREDPTDFLLILVNGRPVRELGGRDTVVKDGDTVAFFIPVLGG